LAVTVLRELYPFGPPANRTQRDLAREVVAEIGLRYRVSIGVRTAQRAVGWASRRRSARN
jgi:hypothetical protein